MLSPKHERRCHLLAAGKPQGEPKGREEWRERGREREGERKECHREGEGKMERKRSDRGGGLWQCPVGCPPSSPSLGTNRIPVLKHRCHCPAQKPSVLPTSQGMKMGCEEAEARGWAASLWLESCILESRYQDSRPLPVPQFQHIEGSVHFS